MPPPPRRRPVPSTPAHRPKVAGLHKRHTSEPTPEERLDGRPLPDAPAAAATTGTPPRVTSPDTAVEDTSAVTAAEPTTAEPDSAEPAESEAGSAGASAPVAGPGTTRTGSGSKPVGRKRTSTRVPSPSPRKDAASDADADAVSHAADATKADRTRSPLLLPLVLVLVAAVLAGLGSWFQTRSRDVRLNEALVDTGGTTEVSGQAREAVERAFSYNFADVAATESAANELLVGKAKCQYNAIFGPVKTLAPEQKLVVTVRVVSSGVTSLEGDRATVLLFIDQVTTRTTDNQTGGGIAMMRVGAQRSDGRWKVDNMEMFGQTGDQSAEMRKCADAE